MSSSKPKRGRVVNCERPDRKPLFELAPEHVGDFIWVHEVELEDGTCLHAYEHRATERYLHLDHDGRAFVIVWEGGQEAEKDSQFEEVDPDWLLELVLARPDERATLIRQNISAELERLRWARSATKHRISRKRIRHVLEHCTLALEEDPPSNYPGAIDKRLVLLGEDADGVALEVIAVEPVSGSLMVIHAMELRPRFRKDYEEVRRWQR